jgi:hypothetical protein
MKIKIYKGKLIQQPHFFILNKGMNTGSPNFKPSANCFVLLAETEEERNFYYWLCFALWQTGKFRPSLIGSVVPFIHIGDLKQVISDATIKANNKPKQYQKSLSLLIDIDRKSEILTEKLKVIEQLKKTLLNIL